MIDAKLKNGDLATDTGGNVEMLSGADAAFQRAVICMTAQKGSFVYNRELGAPSCVPGDSARLALSYSEALAALEDSEINSVRLENNAAIVSLTVNGETREAEVRTYRNI